MLKTFLFIILVMLMKPAFAASIMSHEKFVHLNYEEQRQIVIATMELVVEMESKYQHEVKTSGFNSERFRRYTEFMSKVSSLIFPEANAAGARNVRYGQYLNQLTTILNQRNRCIYGGWISEMRGEKCTHPRNTQFANIYQSESGCTGGNSQITCNPAIFGFKNVGQKSLFCVPAGEVGSDNTSRDCMAKALANPAEAGASSREERIANMIEGIGRNPNDANAVFDFLIKACACDARHSPQISAHYANYMRPHQTCYSILKMMSEVTPQCQVNNQPLMDTNQTQFLNAIRGILSETEMRSNDVETLYTSKLTELRTSNAEFRASETAVCGGSPAIPVVTGSGGSTTPGACVNNRRQPGNEFCCPEGQVPNEARTSCSAGSATNGDGDGDDEDVIVVTGRRPVRPDPRPDVIPDPIPDVITGGGGTQTGTCTNGASNHPDCTTCPNGKQMNTATPPVCVDVPVTPRTCSNGAVLPDCTACPTGKQMNTATPPVCEDAPVTPRTCPNGAVLPECTACPTGKQMNTATPPICVDTPVSSSSVSISLSVTNKDTNTATVTINITPAETVKTEYTLIWFSRGSKRPTTIPGTTTTVTSRPVEGSPDLPDRTATDGDDDEVIADPAPRTDPTRVGETDTAFTRTNGWEPFDVPRQTNDDYEICARIIKNNAQVSESCKKIEKKPGIAPLRNRGGGNPMMQPQMPTRGGPSDAIFRGVR